MMITKTTMATKVPWAYFFVIIVSSCSSTARGARLALP